MKRFPTSPAGTRCPVVKSKGEFDQAKPEDDARPDARQQHAIPILNTFETWLRTEHQSVLPKSLIGKAFTYTRNQ